MPKPAHYQGSYHVRSRQVRLTAWMRGSNVTEDTERRCCTACKVARPIAEFGSRKRFNRCGDCREAQSRRKQRTHLRRIEQATEIDLAAGIKVCAQCRFTMPLDRFHRDARRSDGRFPYCRQCRAERTGKVDPDRKRYQSEYDFLTVLEASRKSSETMRARYLRITYNITPQAYDELLEQQGGGCAICGQTSAETGGSAFRQPSRLAVDHDHQCCEGHGSCGQCVRGLLCGRCNTAIGHFGDDPELLTSALRYLQAWSSQAIG